MKRYIFFIGTMREGGAERVVSLLSNEFVKHGYSVEILMYYDEEIFYDINDRVKITFVERETKTKVLLRNIFWIHKYFKKNAQAVISFLAPFNMLSLVASCGLTMPVIVADRNDPHKVPRNRVIRIIRNFLYHFADGVVLQTRQNQKYFSKYVQRKSVVIYNPVDMREKAGMALSTEKKEQIVTVGRLIPQKNQKMLLDAFAEIHRIYPEYELILYGEGFYRKELERKIAEMGMINCIFLPGKVKDVHERIATAKMFVLCSDYEGMPNALIEAMCLGMPVISTKVSGALDLIEDDKNGVLINVGDVHELINQMLCVLQDSEKQLRYAKKAIELNQVLDMTRVFSQWEDFIRNISRRKGKIYEKQ